MCDDELSKDPFFLQYVPDWFVTQEQITTWHDDDDHCNNDDVLITWHDGYKKRKAQKAHIKKELFSIAWYPRRLQDWCMTEDEKKRITEMFA